MLDYSRLIIYNYRLFNDIIGGIINIGDMYIMSYIIYTYIMWCCIQYHQLDIVKYIHFINQLIN